MAQLEQFERVGKKGGAKGEAAPSGEGVKAA